MRRDDARLAVCASSTERDSLRSSVSARRARVHREDAPAEPLSASYATSTANGVTSTTRMSLVLNPGTLPAPYSAAPSTPASSALTFLAILSAPTACATACWTSGTRDEPPTRMTDSMSLRESEAESRADWIGRDRCGRRAAARASRDARVTSVRKSRSSMRPSICRVWSEIVRVSVELRAGTRGTGKVHAHERTRPCWRSGPA